MSDNELRGLLEQSEPELLRRLLREANRGGLPGDDEQSESLGRALFRQRFEAIQRQVCAKRDALSRQSGLEDRVRDAAALADVLTAMKVGYPVNTMAVLILKHGLDALCGPAAAGQ